MELTKELVAKAKEAKTLRSLWLWQRKTALS